MKDEGRLENPIATGRDGGASRVLLVRHGETFANAKGYLLGTLDEGVDERGAAQSARAVGGIVAWDPDRIYSSPLSRARVSIAEPASRAAGVPLTVDERLREFNFGPLEGRSFEELMAEGLPFPWGPSAADWPPAGGGESMEHFLSRLSGVAEELRGLEGHTVVVAHGGVIRGLLSLWLGLSTDTINQLSVANVHGFILNMSKSSPELEQFGLEPEDFCHYA